MFLQLLKVCRQISLLEVNFKNSNILRNLSEVVQLKALLLASMSNSSDDGTHESLTLSGVTEVGPNGLLVQLEYQHVDEAIEHSW